MNIPFNVEILKISKLQTQISEFWSQTETLLQVLVITAICKLATYVIALQLSRDCNSLSHSFSTSSLFIFTLSDGKVSIKNWLKK